MRNYEFAPPLGDFDMGILFLIVNDVPDVGHLTFFKTNQNIACEARQHDPFAIVYLRSVQGTWYKGEYCYSNSRYKFLPVGMAAVPQLILMMDVLKP